MARIPEQQVTRLKTEVSIVRLVEAAGIELKKHGGADLVGRCPFHDDRTPSLVVSPEKNLWHCLGACGVGGSVIDWVMRFHKVSFRHACELLLKDHPALRLGDGTPPAASEVRQAASPFTLEAGDQALLEQVTDFYHQTLLESSEALEYLEKRGIGDPELIRRFRLGYANRTLGYRLPPKAFKAGAEIRGALQKLGVLRKSGHEHLTGSLVIPVLDDAGQVVQLYGRKLRDNLRKGTAYHLYLPGPHRGVFNRSALNGQPEIILCESLIDALTFIAAGFDNVTTSYGINGFTDEILAALKASGAKRILIAYDADQAGNQAAERVAEKLTGEGFDCFRLNFPKGMDANEYAVKVKPPLKSLGLVIRKAEWLGKGERPDLDTAAPAMPAGSESEPESPLETPAATPEPEPTETSSSLAADPVEPVPEPDPDSEPDLSPAAEALAELPASAIPEPPAADIEAEVTERDVVLRFGDRRWRIRGLQKNTSFDVLKVNLLVSRGEALHVDSFDLYSAKHRQAFARLAAAELELEDSVLQRELGKVLLKCEELQERQIEETLKPKLPAEVEMPEAEREAALSLLRDPKLVDRILEAFSLAGLVGEPVNALVGYLAAVSRKLSQPLAIIIQSTSAAGKSALMDAVLDLVPEEDRIHYSAMTGQSLFYLGEHDLKHKILGIAEEEGVRQASYALKLLQSQGELTIASTGKDPQTGKLVTEEYRVEGPVMLLLTTTAIDIDEELLNRCLVLTVDESRDQTRRIQARQRQARTLEGLLAGEQAKSVRGLHRNAQRLLKPLAVVNPYAERLTFLDERTRTRRDHQKYLTLIDAIALLHQHQRPIKTAEQGGQRIEYVEVEPGDIALANRLAHEVLGRSLDELPPQTRNLLNQLLEMVREACKREGLERREYHFTRRQVREYTCWGDTQLKVHLARLVELEYLLVHRKGQTFCYELAYAGEGSDGQRFLVGLLDPEHLYDGQRSGSESQRSAPGRGVVGVQSAPGRDSETAPNANNDSTSSESTPQSAENAYTGTENLPASNRNATPTPARSLSSLAAELPLVANRRAARTIGSDSGQPASARRA
jgi:DNA primase